MPGVDRVLADLLSRQMFMEFHAEAAKRGWDSPANLAFCQKMCDLLLLQMIQLARSRGPVIRGSRERGERACCSLAAEGVPIECVIAVGRPAPHVSHEQAKSVHKWMGNHRGIRMSTQDSALLRRKP